MPWEREVYLTMLLEHLKEEERRRREEESRRKNG